jgi:hypothetical protein
MAHGVEDQGLHKDLQSGVTLLREVLKFILHVVRADSQIFIAFKTATLHMTVETTAVVNPIMTEESFMLGLSPCHGPSLGSTSWWASHLVMALH